MSNTTGSTINRLYSGFRGVDFRGDEINLVRSPDALNVWRNYRKTQSIETRPELSLQLGFTETVYGIFFYKDMMLVHSGTKLYKVTNGNKTELYTGLNEMASQSFVFEDIWYFKDGKNYLQYNGTKIGDVEGFIPTTSIGRKPNGGGGTIYQDVNMLSDYRINTFLGDGVYASFGLDAVSIDPSFVPIVTVNGVEQTPYDENTHKGDYITYYDTGNIIFFVPPPAPATAGQDNVTIKFKCPVANHKDNILKCTLLQVFDNRVFFSGNPEKPNIVWHCSLSDPTYCSDLDYYKEGMDMAAVKGLVAGNNALWVFKEPNDANTTVFYHVPTLDEEYGKVYPSSHSSVTTGCVGKAINFNDDIVFFSDRGMEGISGDVTTEQIVAHRSSLVDRKLTAEEGYKDMLLEEWDGYLIVFIGNRAYLADSRAMYADENHSEYEWFYFEFDKKITCSKVNDGVLYIGTEDGLYTLNGEADVESYWTTPKDKFQHPHKLKTTNKRGCVAEATGDVSVYAKVEDTDFELIGTYENVTDYFVSRIKRKKFKDIQLKFYSTTRFSLETVTLECVVGGYIKR